MIKSIVQFITVAYALGAVVHESVAQDKSHIITATFPDQSCAKAFYDLCNWVTKPIYWQEEHKVTAHA